MPRNYRKKAIERHGEICQVCGAEENIHVHHKDGDPSNDDISNLIPLCVGCHRKAHGRSQELPQLVTELGYRPRPSGRTTVQVSDELADELHDRKDRGESYEDVIWSLLEAAEGG